MESGTPLKASPPSKSSTGTGTEPVPEPLAVALADVSPEGVDEA